MHDSIINIREITLTNLNVHLKRLTELVKKNIRILQGYILYYGGGGEMAAGKKMKTEGVGKK